MDQGAKGEMSLSDSNLLDVPSPRKPSKAKSVDSGYCGPSRETSTAQLRRSSGLPCSKERMPKESLSLSCVISSSLSNIIEDENVASQLHSTDFQRVASIEASQPSILQLSESHVSLSLPLSSSGSQSQKSIVHITITSSGENLSQPDSCNRSVIKSSHSISMTAEQEDILKRTVESRTHLFTEHTNFVTLLPYLFEKKLVYSGECEKLETFSSNKEKGNHFYTIILPQKGKRAYRRLYKCLKREKEHLGHKDLAEILDKALKGQESPQSSSDSTPTTENNSNSIEGTFDRLGDSKNCNTPLTLKADPNSSSSDGTLIDDKHHSLSDPHSDSSQVHVMSSHLQPQCSHPLDDGDEGTESDPASKETPPGQSSHKSASRNGRTKGCCTIL